MLRHLKRLFGANGDTAAPEEDGIRTPAPEVVKVAGYESFSVADHLSPHNDFPILDWSAVEVWIRNAVPDDKQAVAWGDCERAWLLHLRKPLGASFRVHEGSTAMILSSLSRSEAQAMLNYMDRTLKRVGAVLEGIAIPPPWGKDLLIAFDDQQQYYDYVSHYYPESGEFAFSGGMHINAGCSHFVTIKSDLRSMESVIAHEMTHGCLSHLPIPLWLNEGIAVNTEHRLAGTPPPLHTPERMRSKHLDFWNETNIQGFWSGESFSWTDDGQMLSYDLARIFIEQFSKDWGSFKSFVLAADLNDAGHAAASEFLGISLGDAAASIAEKEPSSAWQPNRSLWNWPSTESAGEQPANKLEQ